MKQKTFQEIEDMYRSYQRLRDKLLLLEPRNTQYLTFTPGGGDGDESKVEKLALARAEIRDQIKVIRRCLGQLTHDERLFVEYRYVLDRPMEIMPQLMNWSRREIYYLRKSVLAKTRWFLNVSNSENGFDTKKGHKCS